MNKIEMAKATLYLGDCRDILKTLQNNSVDSVVTDPPYHLTSIVKRFGKADAAPAQFGTDGAFARASRGFMGKEWDGGDIAFRPEFWAEVYRVLKPGGHLLAFSGSRTYHRMACGIEDAGFEIRDQIMWLYGSGFPKSHDVAKAITATELTGGSSPKNLRQTRQGDEYEPTGQVDYHKGRMFSNSISNDLKKTELTKNAEQWRGWGTAMKPAHEPICVARKPLDGTVAETVLRWGTGALNIDGCRVGSEVAGWQGGAWGGETGLENNGAPRPVIGRWPANIIHDGSDEVVAWFPITKSGNLNQASVKAQDRIYGGGFGNGKTNPRQFSANEGSAARFFYCAKASKRDRDEGLDGFEVVEVTGGGGINQDCAGAYGSKKAEKSNFHPTVKPTDLMRYLCRLVTPPGGVVLDPFMGSGSTGKAAMLEGFRFIGIDMTEEYIAIAKARIENAMSKKGLFD